MLLYARACIFVHTHTHTQVDMFLIHQRYWQNVCRLTLTRHRNDLFCKEYTKTMRSHFCNWGTRDLAAGWLAGESCCNSWLGQEIFLYSKAFWLALGLTHLLIKWVIRAVLLGARVASSWNWPLTFT